MVWFSSVQSLDCLGHQEDMRDDSAESLFQSFLQQALVSGSGRGRYVHSLMLSIQQFLCWPRHHPLSLVPWRMVLERLLWRVTCRTMHVFVTLQLPEEVPVDPEGNWSFSTPSLQEGDTKKFPHALGFESMDPFFRVSKQGPCFTAIEEDGGDQRRGGSCRFCFAILLPLLTLKEKT